MGLEVAPVEQKEEEAEKEKEADEDPDPVEEKESSPVADKEEEDAKPLEDVRTAGEEEMDVRLRDEQREKSVDSKAAMNDPLDVSGVQRNMKEKEVIPTVEAVTTIVPGTTLRRLEDPTPFLFSTASTRPGSLDTATAPIKAAPRYRVLEAPDPEPLMPTSSSMTFAASPYKVLEAPSSPSVVNNSSCSPSASPSSSSNRSMASEVLEKARTRFDRFWTKKDADK